MKRVPVARIHRASVYEIVLVLATGLSAVTNLIDPSTRSRVLQEALTSVWAVTAYCVAAAAGTVAVIVGWLLAERGLRSPNHGPAVGMQVERAGLLLLGPLLCSYAIAMWIFGQTAVLAGAVTFACGAAHIYRAYQITVDLLALRAMTELAEGEP